MNTSIVSFAPYRKILKKDIAADDCLDIIEEYYLSYWKMETVSEIKLLYNYYRRDGYFQMETALSYIDELYNSAINNDMKQIMLCRFLVWNEEKEIGYKVYGKNGWRIEFVDVFNLRVSKVHDIEILPSLKKMIRKLLS